MNWFKHCKNKRVYTLKRSFNSVKSSHYNSR